MALRADCVVVGVDGSDASQDALEWAAGEAELRATTLALVHAVGQPPLEWSSQLVTPERMQRAALDMLTAARDDVYDSHPGLDVDLELSYVPSAQALLELGQTAALVVVGSRHRGPVGRLFLGSTSHFLATRCRVPVAVVRERPTDPHAPILVGVDGTPASDRALEYAFERAAERRVALHAVLAWRAADIPVGYGIYRVDAENLPATKLTAQRQLDAALAPLREAHPEVEVRGEIVQGNPTAVLVEAADGAQMVVVGSHGSGTAVRLLLGSVSSNLLHGVALPVVVVRTADDERER
jgi:nucleotide-binding universal stress UspA family protein